MKGTVVVNETVFPIVDIRLEQGVFVLEGRLEGPVQPFEGGVTDMQVFDQSGRSVCEVQNHCHRWYRAREGDSVTVLFRMAITEAVSV